MDFVLYNLDVGVALPDLTPEQPVAVELPEPVREAA